MAPWSEKFRAILSVYLVLQKEDGSVLLLRRQNTGFMDGMYGLPAGHVDGNETLHKAMVREAKEEANITIHEHDLSLIHTMHRHCGDHERTDFFFLCQKWDGEPKNIEPEKCDDLSWHQLHMLPENVIEYYVQMFNEWQKGNPLSYYGWDELGK